MLGYLTELRFICLHYTGALIKARLYNLIDTTRDPNPVFKASAFSQLSTTISKS